MAPFGVIKKRGNKTVVETKDGAFEASIPFEEVREFINSGALRWKVGKYIIENGNEYVFTSYEEFDRAAFYVLLRKGKVPKKEAGHAAEFLKSSEVDAVVGGLFLRLLDCNLTNDPIGCRRTVAAFIDIAKAYAKLDAI
jgi:hypothetical protein